MDVEYLPPVHYKLTVIGQPVPKARPRYTTRNGAVYTEERTREAEDLIQLVFMDLYGKPRHTRRTTKPPSPGTFFRVDCWFFTKARFRADIDNYLKTVLDALNDVAWEDDSQVWASCCYRLLDKNNPRTEIVITSIDVDYDE